MNVLQHTRNELNLSPAKSTGPLLQRHSLKFVKGKDLLIADALSRSQTTGQKGSKFEHEIEATRVVHEDQSVTISLAEMQRQQPIKPSYSQ